MTETPEQLALNLLRLEDEKKVLVEKIVCFESEKKQHTLVLDALQQVEPTRRCYHLVGDVLLPRTVEEVKPSLMENCAKITETLSNLNTSLENVSSKYSEIAKVLKPALDKKIPVVTSESVGGYGTTKLSKDVDTVPPEKHGGVLV